MGKALLISAAYGWFIGLLVMMIIMALLFVFIALVALKPYKIDDAGEDSASALKLLEAKEAELTVTLLKKNNDAAVTEEITKNLREVESAKRLVKQLLESEYGTSEQGGVTLGYDSDLTEAEAQKLEGGEKVSIEQTFGDAERSAEDNGLEKSFTAKLMQSADEVKVWYFELKNCILCYEKSKALMRWNNEKFYVGRDNVATLTMRGKQLCLYLALNAEEYSARFPVKTSTSQLYNQATPCLFRIKNDKSIKQAKELIALLMADYGVMYVKTNHSIYALPYEDDDALVAKGLAVHKEENSDITE